MLLEEANKTLIDNAVIGALLTNPDLSDEDLKLVSKWGHEPLSSMEVVRLLDILHLQILPLG